MSDVANTLSAEEITQKIRTISGRGHTIGLSTPFTHGALLVIHAGGRMPEKAEKALIQVDFITASRTLTDDGQALLDLHAQRGDKPFIWAQEMAEKAAGAPRLVAA